MCASRASRGMYVNWALLREHRALLREYRALLREHRALLRANV